MLYAAHDSAVAHRSTSCMQHGMQAAALHICSHAAGMTFNGLVAATNVCTAARMEDLTGETRGWLLLKRPQG